MRIITAILAGVAVSAALMAQKGAATIVERRNVPLALTVFSVSQNPQVRTRIGLSWFSLKTTPYATQSFDRRVTIYFPNQVLIHSKQ